MTSRKQATKVKPRRHAPLRKRQATPRAALMRIPAPPKRAWELSLDEVALVRNHIAKGASDTELQFCLAVARRHRLDPFRGQIWFVKRYDKTAEGNYRWVPITGINGMLHIAARDHKDFGSNDEPEFGPMHAVKWRWKGEGKENTLQAPEWAKVTLWKKGHEHPIVAKVFWEEIYPDVDFSPLVRQMPRLMLGKCALAQAVRRAYPATDGLYIKEEFQGPPEFTPGGRVMEVIPAQTEAEKNWDAREAAGIEKLNPAQKEVVQRKMAEAKSSQMNQQAPAEREGAEAAGRHTAPQPDTLHYELMPSGSYEISGPEEILKANRDLLKPLWSPVARAVMATPQQLGALLSQLEQRKVPIRDKAD